MNLINCTHRCKYQSYGYCTLKVLNGVCSSPINDCIYFCSSEDSSQFPNVSDRDQF